MSDIKFGSKKLMIIHYEDWLDLPLSVIFGIKPYIRIFGYYIYIITQENDN